ncbi:hypothetical protein K469DRAFT_306614 [Zopfia rhizophila CBS 207.26]|uniref:Uncharacterized protein n=1 Tax=Zopfia rhizophila CBS 207.26 TaxID=1314779 RepID=A0A6A6ELW5_9PEZI|nr:hypothetical protein K469DRAFT_306614 [Zopfia rhizophila CBS 207.26]
MPKLTPYMDDGGCDSLLHRPHLCRILLRLTLPLLPTRSLIFFPHSCTFHEVVTFIRRSLLGDDESVAKNLPVVNMVRRWLRFATYRVASWVFGKSGKCFNHGPFPVIPASSSFFRTLPAVFWTFILVSHPRLPQSFSILLFSLLLGVHGY